MKRAAGAQGTPLPTKGLVKGNIKALEDSSLDATDNDIKGNVEGDKAEQVTLTGNDIRGNVTVNEGHSADGDDVGQRPPE